MNLNHHPNNYFVFFSFFFTLFPIVFSYYFQNHFTALTTRAIVTFIIQLDLPIPLDTFVVDLRLTFHLSILMLLCRHHQRHLFTVYLRFCLHFPLYYHPFHLGVVLIQFLRFTCSRLFQYLRQDLLNFIQKV